MRGRIATKIANTTGMVIDRLDHLSRAKPLSIPNPFAMRPVLTEETVKRTPVVEGGKVLKPKFWTGGMGKLRISGTGSTRTDPSCHTISWQLIKIPAYISCFTGDPAKNSIFLSPQTTIAPASFRDLTLIGTDLAGDTCRLPGRVDHQLEWFPGAIMGLFDEGLGTLLS